MCVSSKVMYLILCKLLPNFRFAKQINVKKKNVIQIKVLENMVQYKASFATVAIVMSRRQHTIHQTYFILKFNRRNFVLPTIFQKVFANNCHCKTMKTKNEEKNIIFRIVYIRFIFTYIKHF